MAFFYVKSGGEATGDAGRAATKRTGSFATMGVSAYYASISAALSATTTPTDGDYICVSDASTESYASDTGLDFSANIVVLSVSDTNADQYSAGASLTVNPGGLTFTVGAGKTLRFKGVSLTLEDELAFGISPGYTFYFEDASIDHGTYGSSASDNEIRNDADGAELRFSNVTYTPADGAASIFEIDAGGRVFLNNFNTTGTNTVTSLVDCAGSAGGSITLESCDISTLASVELLDLSAGANSDNFEMILRNCKMPSTYTLGTVDFPIARIELANCANNNKYTSAAVDYFGYFVTDTTNTRTGGATVDGQLISYSVSTTANALKGLRAFKFKLGAVHADFSSANKTITVHMLHDSIGGGTSSDVTDTEVWIEVHVPSTGGPNKVVYSSRNTQPFDATGTDYTDESGETWTTTGLTTAVQQSMSITTDFSGDSLDTGLCEVWVAVSLPSITQGDLFIDPKIEIA